MFLISKNLYSFRVLDQLPSYKSVSVGDKLKVYYGPTHESKVTYEAKVMFYNDTNLLIIYLVKLVYLFKQIMTG